MLTPAKLDPAKNLSSVVSDRLTEYVDYWGLDDVSVTQFSPVWPEGDSEGIGAYAIDPVWYGATAAMQHAGFHFMLYLFDNWYRTDKDNLVDQSYLTQGWEAETITRTGGNLYLQDHDLGLGPKEYAKIDTASPKWLKRMAELGTRLGLLHVDGVYFDNFFPALDDVNYASPWHPAGYGSWFGQSFDLSIAMLRTFARERTARSSRSTPRSTSRATSATTSSSTPSSRSAT